MSRTHPTSLFITISITSLFCLAPGIAAAAPGWGNENWGELLWGTLSVPLLGTWGLGFLSALVLLTGIRTSRARRTKGAFAFALMLALPLAVGAVTLPNTFVNGTVADADEVNANFNAVAYRTIPRTTGLGPQDGTDVGAISTRTLTVDKDQADTDLRISYTDNFRVLGNNSACRWEIRVDGASCASGALVYDYFVSGTAFTHKSHTVVGYCGSLGAGSHDLQVWVGPSPGYAATDCFTGWNNSSWALEAEEVQ